MRGVRVFGVALLCLSAAGCQLPAAPGPAASLDPHMRTNNAGLIAIPECATGVSATLVGGVRIDFVGSDFEDPQRCQLQWADRSHSLYFGFWNSDAKAPMSEEARDALRTALMGPVGTETSFETQRARLWSRVSITHLANRVVEVEGKQRPALELRVVRHDTFGRPDVQAETRFMIDRATGVLLRRQTITPMVDGGVTTTTSWQVGALHGPD